jgi:multiple sugar transport system substrate-binding protein
MRTFFSNMARSAAVGLIALTANAIPAVAATELIVQYPQPQLFKEIHETIAAEFQKQNPDIKIKFRAPYPGYGDALQAVLREAISDQLPEVTFQGLNRLRPLADRGIAVDLGPFIAKESSFEGQGWTPALRSLGIVYGKQYGLGFSASVPLMYINADLIRKAGGDPDNVPTDWESIITLAKKVDALGDDITGAFYPWDDDDWLFQAAVLSHGGTMMNDNETEISFNGLAGKTALDLHHRLRAEANMPLMTYPQGVQKFLAGQTGIQFESAASVDNWESSIGDKFEMRAYPYPIAAASGRLPTGGSVGVILTKDPKKQEEAWKYLKFATGPFGAMTVVHNTGYLPTNALAATAAYLGDFYDKNPNRAAALKALPIMAPWYAFPGENAGKIQRKIMDHLQLVVDGSETVDEGLANMTADVNKLLP